MRRNRNRSEYGSRLFGSAEIEDALRTSEVILEIGDRHVR